MSEPDVTFWLNGEFREDVQAINIADRGFLLGDGVFETLLVRDGVAAFLNEHLARLRDGLNALSIIADAPPDVEKIISRLIVDCNIQGDASVRITISRGPSGRGLAFPRDEQRAVTTLISAQPAAHHSDKPLSLKVSQYVRPETSIAARCKTLNYLDNVLARNEALAAGADDAVMLNGHGRIACASAANIFIIDQAGVVSTPPVDEGALPGIARGQILQAAAHIDVAMREAPLERQALQSGSVFLTNSLIGLRPAMMVGGGINLSSPAASQILQRLQSWYEARLRDSIIKKARNS